MGLSLSSSSPNDETGLTDPVLNEKSDLNTGPIVHSIECLDNALKERTPIRLVLCIDGTWTDEDGFSNISHGNISNIYRIHCMVKNGKVYDEHSQKWYFQHSEYHQGVHDPNSWMGNLRSGYDGSGPDGVHAMVARLYKTIARYKLGPEDELFLFGWSRGAYILKPTHISSNKPFQTGLGLYKAIRERPADCLGKINEYFKRCKPEKELPTIKFIGVFDTVKAFDDRGLYHSTPVPSVPHYRQALALHERRQAFISEQYAFSQDAPDCDIQQAWFVGAHADMGGANSKDGLSLYPLQWIVHEAKLVGLGLGGFIPQRFQTQTGPGPSLEDPERSIFPSNLDKAQKLQTADGSYVMKLTNGINVHIWDLRETYSNNCNYKLNINKDESWLFSLVGRVQPERDRAIFDNDNKGDLIGWIANKPIGTFIHPSAYFFYDWWDEFMSKCRDWDVGQSFLQFRSQVISDDNAVFWDRCDYDKKLEKVRILICGESGVGKSTLINKTFGLANEAQTSAQVSHDGAGKHNIRHEYSPSGSRYAIHDSCGFQATNDRDWQDFVKFIQDQMIERDLAKRLHTIWYCVSCEKINRNRIFSDVDELFMQTLSVQSRVPIILIFTRKDDLEAVCKLRVERQNPSADKTEIDRLTLQRLEDEMQRARDVFEDRWLSMSYEGPVFIEQDDADSIKAVMALTLENLNHTPKLRDLCSSAQIADVTPKIDQALSRAFRCYGHGVGWGAIPLPFTAMISMPIAVERTCTAIMDAFNYSGFHTNIMLEVLSTVFLGNYESNTAQLGTQVVNAGAFIASMMEVAGFGIVAGVSAQVCNILAVPQVGRVLVMVIADVTLIMERAFWHCVHSESEQKILRVEDIRNACAEYGKSNSRVTVHEKTKALIGIFNVWKSWKTRTLEAEVKAIVYEERYRRV